MQPRALQVTVRAALMRASAMLGDFHAAEHEIAALVEPLSFRLATDAPHRGGVVAPLPAILKGVLQLMRRQAVIAADDGHSADSSSDGQTPDGQTPDGQSADRALRHAGFNLLASAMRRRTAILASPRHAGMLNALSGHDAHLLFLLARRFPAPLLTRLELRCETLRNRAPLPRRIRVVDEGQCPAAELASWPLTRSHTENLERLLLVDWCDRSITPSEDPEFTRVRRQARLGSMTASEGFRRWLAGKHMAPVNREERQSILAEGVGGIELTYRTLALTETGRAFVFAARDQPVLINRGRQSVYQGSLQQLHALR